MLRDRDVGKDNNENLQRVIIMKNRTELLKYTATHEWIYVEEHAIARVGITEHAQRLLGDIVFAQLPESSQVVKQCQEICVLESVKAAADVYTPLTGEVIEINTLLSSTPELINTDPYGKGWLFCVKFSVPSELENLLDFMAYQQHISVEAH